MILEKIDHVLTASHCMWNKTLHYALPDWLLPWCVQDLRAHYSGTYCIHLWGEASGIIDGLKVLPMLYLPYGILYAIMIMSLNGNLFCVTGPVWGESIAFPSKASEPESPHRPVTQSFDVSVQNCSWCWLTSNQIFETHFSGISSETGIAWKSLPKM